MRRDEANVTGGESDVGRGAGNRKQDARESRVMDREVPLPAASGHAALHHWLDGEVEQSSARDAEGSLQVDLWNRINAETQMLRSRTTPVYVQKAIMSALPDETPATSTTVMGRTGITPKTLLWVAAGVVAVAGAVFAAALFR
jgi:hypothetical protein